MALCENDDGGGLVDFTSFKTTTITVSARSRAKKPAADAVPRAVRSGN